MPNIIKVVGMRNILDNLAKARAGLGLGMERGLKEAGLHLQRESQLACPVDIGTLKNSAFTQAEGSGLRTEVFVGYTMNYALFVHEMAPGPGAPGGAGHPKRKRRKTTTIRKAPVREGRARIEGGSGAIKYLERPAKRERFQIVAIIKKHLDRVK